jgi:glycerol-3-phosphate O-acyltransferase
MAHRVLCSFLEAYHIVAECLLASQVGAPIEESRFLSECLALGEQLRLQHRISGAEAVSTELFRSALKLAENRGLLGTGTTELAAAREAFAEELRDLVRRIHVVAELDRAQRHSDALVPAAAGRA